jgi:hypothetical protein
VAMVLAFFLLLLRVPDARNPVART